MKVIATAKGFYGALIEPGQVFDVPDGTKGAWFKRAGKEDEGREVSGNKAGKSATTTANVDAITKATT